MHRRSHRVQQVPRSQVLESPSIQHVEKKAEGAFVSPVKGPLFHGGGRGRLRSDRRASVSPVKGFLFEGGGRGRLRSDRRAFVSAVKGFCSMETVEADRWITVSLTH